MYRYAIEHQEPGDPRTVRTFTSWRPVAAMCYIDLTQACGPKLRPWFTDPGIGYIVPVDANPISVNVECQTFATLEERNPDEPVPGGGKA
jgi:hypothetical protein